jgi:hypothetical protein
MTEQTVVTRIVKMMILDHAANVLVPVDQGSLGRKGKKGR